MADFPKEAVKVTTHKPPRHMLYQPGFNPGCSCWLHGDWITVSQVEWKLRRFQHVKMYGKIREMAKGQSHHDKRTALKNMSLAQRQAWRHFSGQIIMECEYTGDAGYVGPAGIDLAGNCIAEKSLKWLRKRKMRILTEVTSYGKIRHQLRGYKGVPEDVVRDTSKNPIDTVARTIDKNVRWANKCAEGYLGIPSLRSMGVHRLIELETEIVRAEWLKKTGKPNMYDDIPKAVQTYKKHRKLCIGVLGAAEFKKIYNSCKASHNSCARANLGEKGLLYSFFLPKFKADGTHESWGEKDVPWGQEGKKS